MRRAGHSKVSPERVSIMRFAILATLAALAASPAVAKAPGAVACSDLPTVVQIKRAPDTKVRADMIANGVKSGACRVFANTACLIPSTSRAGFSCMKTSREAASCLWINLDDALDHAGAGRACS